MTLEQELNIRYEKGVAEGRVEGADSAKRELARVFRDRGVAIDVIVESTGLSPEKIKTL